MNPQRFPEANGTLGPPAGMTDEECCTIHVFQSSGSQGHFIISAWRPSPEELVKLNLGEPLWLYIHGTGMPPVSLVVDNPFEQKGQTDE